MKNDFSSAEVIIDTHGHIPLGRRSAAGSTERVTPNRRHRELTHKIQVLPPMGRQGFGQFQVASSNGRARTLGRESPPNVPSTRRRGGGSVSLLFPFPFVPESNRTCCCSAGTFYGGPSSRIDVFWAWSVAQSQACNKNSSIERPT